MAKRSTPKTDKKIDQTPDGPQTQAAQKTTKPPAAKPRRTAKPAPMVEPPDPDAPSTPARRAPRTPAARKTARAPKAARPSDAPTSASADVQVVQPSGPALDILMVTPEAR